MKKYLGGLFIPLALQFGFTSPSVSAGAGPRDCRLPIADCRLALSAEVRQTGIARTSQDTKTANQEKKTTVPEQKPTTPEQKPTAWSRSRPARSRSRQSTCRIMLVGMRRIRARWRTLFLTSFSRRMSFGSSPRIRQRASWLLRGPTVLSSPPLTAR